MSNVVKPPTYKVGEKVRIIGPWQLVGTIREIKAAVTANGATLYYVYVPMDPEPMVYLLREDEMEKVA